MSDRQPPTVYSRHEEGDRAVVVQHEAYVRHDGTPSRRLVRVVERKLHGGKWIRDSFVRIRASELRSTIEGLTKALRGEAAVDPRQTELLGR